MRLKAGEIAPGFRVKDIDDRIVDLADFRGSPLLLCFYRYAGCPYCNLFLHEIITRHAEYEKHGLKIVTFFQSPKGSLMSIPARQKPGFPLVADPGRVIYDAYGVESSAAKMAISLLHLGAFIEAHMEGYFQRMIDGDFFLLPAEFLIKPDGTIDTAHYAEHLADRLSDLEIMDFLCAVKSSCDTPDSPKSS